MPPSRTGRIGAHQSINATVVALQDVSCTVEYHHSRVGMRVSPIGGAANDGFPLMPGRIRGIATEKTARKWIHRLEVSADENNIGISSVGENREMRVALTAGQNIAICIAGHIHWHPGGPG